jgi:hypothetical protein
VHTNTTPATIDALEFEFLVRANLGTAAFDTPLLLSVVGTHATVQFYAR